MIYIGIDNGLNGGIAVIDEEERIVEVVAMPVIKGRKSAYDIEFIHYLLSALNSNRKCRAVLEKAQVFPISGKKANFMNGYGFGVMEGLLTSIEIPYEIVSPKTWQKEIFKGLDYTDTKQASILFCKRKYPGAVLKATERSRKYHDGICDALCMAIYAKRGVTPISEKKTPSRPFMIKSKGLKIVK